MDIVPVTLSGAAVRLEPLTPEHVPGLVRAGADPAIWRWSPTEMASEDDMREYVDAALDEQRRSVSLPFAILDAASGEVIGSTRYGNIEAADRRLEIGWTWLAPAYQRTRANTETKFLLLSHAFDDQGAIRVELKTDVLNEQSRNAIVRLGAVQEGVFRNHRITWTGRVRDTIYFSILDTEWPAVKARLVARLG